MDWKFEVFEMSDGNCLSIKLFVEEVVFFFQPVPPFINHFFRKVLHKSKLLSFYITCNQHTEWGKNVKIQIRLHSIFKGHIGIVA
ncbi:hypothetical protein D3C85_1372370 [compost metagenome]